MVPIPGSNLILLVFEVGGCSYEPGKKVSITPIEKNYNNESTACYRRNNDKMTRKRPAICINHHVNVSLNRFYIFLLKREKNIFFHFYIRRV